jgi:hypothetical protein
MKNKWNKKAIVFGIIIILFCSTIFPGISSKKIKPVRDEILIDESYEVEEEVATLTFNTFNENGKKEVKIELPLSKAKYIFYLFEELRNMTISHPNSQETLDLKNRFIDLLEEYGLIPGGMSASDIQPLINPHGTPDNPKSRGRTGFLGLIFDILFSNRFNHLRLLDPLDYPSDWSIFCNVAGGGYGIPLPLFILPRPRAITVWGATFATTAVGSLVMPKSFVAIGNQQGICLGFVGVGITIAFFGFMGYGMLGYSLYTAVRAQEIERYNNIPTITNENPPSGSTNVPVSLSELNFRLTDGDGDLMSYSVTTYPDIGGGSGNNKGNGVYSVPVSGLDSDTDYTWYVSVDDAYDTVEKTFTFKTEAVAPLISNPSPGDNEKYVPVSLSELIFHLKDFQNDPMDYTVETVPDIGSGSGDGVGEGTYSVPVSGLDYSVEYIWYVNVTDGEHQTNKVFRFQADHDMVFDPFNDGWQYRKEITVDHNMVDGDLTSFPLLISTVDVDLRDKAQDDGDDILFMDDVGVATRLYHEIESFYGSSGELVAWVTIPSLSSSADTSFYMYYGNSGSYCQQAPEKVWDSHYLFVSHMGSTGTTIDDSTFNGNDGTKDGVNAPEEVRGKIGECQDFDKDNSEHIVLDSAIAGLPAITVEVWETTRSLDEKHVAHNICTMFDSDGDGDIAWRFRSGVEKDFVIDIWKNQGLVGHATGGSAKLDETWQWIVGTWTGSECYLYVNSIEVADDQTASGTMSSHANMKTTIGGLDFPYGTFHDGMLDEIRISDTARSNDWVSTSYNTMNDPSSFFSVGPEESAP